MPTFQAPTALSSVPADEVAVSALLGAGGIALDPATGYYRLTDVPNPASGIAVDPATGYARVVTLPHAGARTILRLNQTDFTL